MVGFHKEETYIKKYGEKEGRKRFTEVMKERKQRDIRKSNDISIKLGDDLVAEVEAGNAIKCLECGYIGTRLQWTHFRHKCTGRFQNGKEYMAAYPGSMVVAPNLAKSTVVTKEKMLLKYGDEEGSRRWRQYCEQQATVNTLEYKQEKYGWTEEDFAKYNQSRAVTLRNLIDRHGLDEGTRIWDEYCERQRQTTTLEYFVEKYGHEEGSARYEHWAFTRIKNGNGPVSKSETKFLDEIKTKLHTSNEAKPQQYVVGKVSDFADPHYKLCIEFNGDYWHMNPNLYESSAVNANMKITAEEIWQRDARKLRILEDAGYEVLVVWEQDWRSDRDGTCERAVEWWNNKVAERESCQG